MKKEESAFKREERRIKTFVKKHKVLVISLTVIISIILLTSGTKLILYLNFLVGNDVVIKVDVSDEFLSLHHGENQTISFNSLARTNPFCQAECTSEFYDISNDRVIEQDTFILKAASPLEKEFTITNNRPGEGLDLYRFSMACKSEDSTFCETAGKSTTRRILITVERTLTQKEEQLQQEQKEQLTTIVNALTDIHEQESIIVNTSTAVEELLVIDSYDPTLVNSVTEILLSAEDLWKTYDYETLEALLPSLEEDIVVAQSSIDEYFTILSSTVNSHNLLIDEIELSRTIIQDMYSVELLSSEQRDTVNDFITNFNNLDIAFAEKNLLEKKQNAVFIFSYQVSNYSGEVHQAFVDKAISIDVVLDDVCLTTGTCISHPSAEERKNQTLQQLRTACDVTLPTTVNITLPSCDTRTTSGSVNQITVQPLVFPPLPQLDPVVNITVPEPQCCVYGDCQSCCPDCNNYPVIFLHGHAFNKEVSAEYSLDAFNSIQELLEIEGFLNAGAISLYSTRDTPEGIWGLPQVPLTIKASYYFDLFEAPENYVVVQTKSESIDTYAIRLKELIDTIQYKTGKDKVVIVAYSMGGLVSRRYLQVFGDDEVSKLILVGTPNKGIVGNSAEYCSLIGEKLECRDMNANSLFINKLNRGSLPSIPVINIIGTGCDMDGKQGDGVVLEENAFVEGFENHIFEGSCMRLDHFHEHILDVKQYPEVYQVIRDSLTTS